MLVIIIIICLAVIAGNQVVGMKKMDELNKTMSEIKNQLANKHKQDYKD